MAKAKLNVVEVPKEQTIGDMIERMETLRIQRRELAAKDAPLKEEYDDLKRKVIEQLDKTKQTKAAWAGVTVSISETDVPVVKDAKALIKYIVREDLFHLFLAQPLSTPSWREAKGLKGSDLPGTESFMKRDLKHSSS